jgi:hypothetical protein
MPRRRLQPFTPACPSPLRPLPSATACWKGHPRRHASARPCDLLRTQDRNHASCPLMGKDETCETLPLPSRFGRCAHENRALRLPLSSTHRGARMTRHVYVRAHAPYGWKPKHCCGRLRRMSQRSGSERNRGQKNARRNANPMSRKRTHVNCSVRRCLSAPLQRLGVGSAVRQAAPPGAHKDYCETATFSFRPPINASCLSRDSSSAGESITRHFAHITTP